MTEPTNFWVSESEFEMTEKCEGREDVIMIEQTKIAFGGGYLHILEMDED
jgi:hypothetical protein